MQEWEAFYTQIAFHSTHNEINSCLSLLHRPGYLQKWLVCCRLSFHFQLSRHKHAHTYNVLLYIAWKPRYEPHPKILCLPCFTRKETKAFRRIYNGNFVQNMYMHCTLFERECERLFCRVTALSMMRKTSIFVGSDQTISLNNNNSDRNNNKQHTNRQACCNKTSTFFGS